MKQRFSSLDVTVIAHELSKSLSTLRVANIYDLSSRIFLFKFQKPGSREQLVIDSGFRCHLTQYARTTATEPSPFVERLRKVLKTRRVTSVSQVGTDRIIEFTFSDGQYRLFLEFYAAGNIVLTDADLKVLALQRAVNEGEEHERLRLGLQYDLSMRQNYAGIPELTVDRIKTSLEKSIARKEKDDAAGKNQKKKEKDALRKAIVVSMPEFPPLLVDHAFHVKKFDSTLKPEQVLDDQAKLQELQSVLEEAGQTLKYITRADVAQGFILAKRKPSAGDTDEASNSLLYEDFHPFKPSHFADDPSAEYLDFQGFNKTVDEFFSSIEGQKLESRLHEREATAKRKLEQAREDHAKRLGGLQEAQQLHVRKADAIKANVERVYEATGAVNGLIEKGMDWVEIAHLIEREQKQGNAVAQLIKLPLKLHENTITVLLAEQTFDDEDDDEGDISDSTATSSDSEDENSAERTRPAPQKDDKRLAIDINLGLTPWQNANDYYSEKKSAAVKEEKTAQALDKALKSTEKKIASDLKKGLQQEKDVLRPVRGKFWFEKFIWFVSSDGYLVIGGKDAQQQEMIYQRHLRKGDVYVHADLHGAVPFVIQNHDNTPDAPFPPSTLSQAGSYAVCTSHAWDSKAVFSAWWVNADEVSKTGRTGEYLAVGAFNITGRKNFLPPAQLLLGFAVVFQIDEASAKNHVKHRVTAEPAEGGKTDEREGATEDDSDDEFPDAKLGSNSDDDDDFPDAKLETASDEDDSDEEKAKDRSNPLDATNGAESAKAESNDVDNEGQASEDSSPEIVPTTSENTKQQGQKPRYLSARERRQLRKGKTNDVTDITGGGNAEVDAGAESLSDAGSTQTTQTQTQDSKPSKPTQLPRGKRAKQKRLAAKYAEQDDEDKALALKLLGAQPQAQTKTDDGGSVDKAAAQKEKEQEAMEQKQRRREQHLKAQEEGRKKEEERRKLFENTTATPASNSATAQDPDTTNSTQLPDEEPTHQSPLSLSTLTGRPLPTDAILSALPLCAPYSSLSSYKYKIKLQPGVLKRGKAVKEILSRWETEMKDPKRVDEKNADAERMWRMEIDAIRAGVSRLEEVVGTVPVGKCRVVWGGAGVGGKGAGGGGGGGGKGKGKGGRGGRGSKKK